ncbi:Protein SCAR2 [Apostasia shenzhenica]|uniref:Protein SCAR2 n=1 Tax=Apostasia shenzhenica TaxID=1088818 RepID=A0A2I0B5T6_9ASPA|nr:Protein SCAR2 [Apostasia shenzhenica]
MPMVRYQIRSEYGLADPDVYREAEKDDPEALLEGVAMAGLVGVLRQLGDLADFAAELFHDLHEEVMTTSARGHGLMLRVEQIEAEFLSVEKASLSQTDHSNYAYSIGIEWHAHYRMDQNLVTQGDMPRFILDSYEECRGPPRLFMLDKFDVAGAGACLKRYSDPSFFKMESTSFEMMEAKVQRDKRSRKFKRNGSRWRSETESFFAPFMDNSQFNASGQASERILPRHVKLKHRNFGVAYLSSRMCYLEGLLEGYSFDRNDLKNSSSHSVIGNNVDTPSKVWEFADDGVTDSLAVKKRIPSSLDEGEVDNHKTDGEDLMVTTSIFSGLSREHPSSQDVEQGTSPVGANNRVDSDAFAIISEEPEMTPALKLAKQSKLSADSGSLTDGYDGYRSDDVGSELENYVDALNNIEGETETDSENRQKSDACLPNNSQRKNLDIIGHLQVQDQFYGPAFVGSFSESATSEEIEDEIPTLLQLNNLVCLPILQLQEKTISEDTSGIEVSQSDTRKLTRIEEDSALNPKLNFEESQPISAQSTRSFSDSTFEGNEHSESSFNNWQTNNLVVFRTSEEHLNKSFDVLEELDHRAQCEDRVSANLLEPDSSNFLHDSTLTTLPMVLNIVESETLPNDLHIDMQSNDLAKEDSGYEMDSFSEEREQLNCLIEYPSETHELPLLANDVIASPEFAVDSENFAHDLASFSDGGGLHNGRQDYSEKDSSLGDKETLLLSEMANLYEMPETRPTLAENSVLLGSTAHAEDSLNDLMEENNETYTNQKQFPAGSPELPLLLQDANVSYGSTENYDNLLHSSALLSNESGSSHGSQIDSQLDQFSGDTEDVTSSGMTNSWHMSEYPRTHAETSLPEVSTGYVDDSLHGSMVKDNEDGYVEKLFPTSSSSLEICSNTQTESFAVEMEYISSSEEHFQHPKSPASCGNFDIVQCESVTSPPIPSDLEHFADADENQVSTDMVTEECIRSDCREELDANQSLLEEPNLIKCDEIEHFNDALQLANIDANQLQLEEPNLIKCDEIEHFNDALQLANMSTDLNLQYNQLLVEETNDSRLLDEIVFPEDDDGGLLKSSIVCSFDSQLQLNVVSEDTTFYQPLSEVEELPITKESTYFPSENNRSVSFTQNEDLDFGAVSGCQSSDAKGLDAKPVNIHSDLHLSPEQKKIYSIENMQNSESLSENVVNVDVNDGQVLCQLQSSSVSRLGLQFQEDQVSEGDSMNQHKPVTEEPGNTNDIMCLNKDQEMSASTVSSSHLVPNLSKFPDANLVDVDFEDILVESHLNLDEKNSIYLKEYVQSYPSNSFGLHVCADTGNLEILSKRDSVTQSLQRGGEDIEPTAMHSNLDCSEETSDAQNASNQEELFPSPKPGIVFDNGRKRELNIPLPRTDESGQTEIDAFFLSDSVSEHPTSSMAFEALDSGSALLADSIIPHSSLRSASPDESISNLQIQQDDAEAPPLPPLPPLQWRMGKPHLGSLVTGGSAAQIVLETNPSVLSSASKGEMDQYSGLSESTFLEDMFHQGSLYTDGGTTELLKLSNLQPVIIDDRQERVIQFPEDKEVHPLDHSLILPSNNDDNGVSPAATSFEDVKHQELNSGNPFTTKERKPHLINLLPGLELERLQGSPIIDNDLRTSNSFIGGVSSAGNAKYQYGYGDYVGYGGGSMGHQSSSAPFAVPVHSIPHYTYHMYLRDGNPSSIYDIMLPEIEVDRPNGNPRSIRNRPRDPLIEAVAAHDKSTLRKVSEIDLSLTKPKEDERNHLLDQIKNKSFNLKSASSAKRNIVKAPETNLNVAAILEKANAIRKACVGSDEDDGYWSDS